jgi:hypothetical protein
MSMNVFFFFLTPETSSGQAPFFRLAGAKVTILFKLTRLFKIIFEFILNSSFLQFINEQSLSCGVQI